MSQPLISVSSLIRGSWNDAHKHMKATARIALWLWIVIAIYQVAIYFLVPIRSLWAYSVPVFGWRFIILSLIAMVPALWLSVRFMRLVLSLDNNQAVPVQELNEVSGYVLPLLWILILMLIVDGVWMAVTMLIARNVILTIIAIIPIVFGIWISTCLKFSPFLLIEDNKRGVSALKASYTLIKGRWWAAFWRMLAPSVVFALPFYVVAIILSLVLRVFLPSIILRIVIDALAIFFLVPLVLIVSVKLFRSLKQTKMVEAPSVAPPPTTAPPAAPPIVPTRTVEPTPPTPPNEPAPPTQPTIPTAPVV